MQKIKYRISLDMLEVASQTTIKAKKGDTACSIVMTLTENGKIYHIADGCRAIFSGKKADGNYLFNGETCRIEDNAIIYDFTEQTVSMEGVVQCEVVLYKDDEQLTTPRFNLLVDETVYNPDAIVSTPEADALKGFIEDSENRVNSIIEDGENLIEEVGEIHRNSNQYFANAIKGTASNVKDGVVSNDGVYITDISPLEHNINVKVDNAEATVTRSGKNLYNQASYPIISEDGLDIWYIESEDCICIHGERLTSKLQKDIPINPIIVGEFNDEYTLSVENIGGTITYKDNITTGRYANTYLKTKESLEDKKLTDLLEVTRMLQRTTVKASGVLIEPEKYITHIRFYITPNVKFDYFKIRVQLEKGSEATEYGKYVAPTEHTPNADGTLIVPSVYPTTILESDTKGVTIEAEYNRDTVKMFKTNIKDGILYVK
jgi:hypothetical protein